MGRFYQSIAVVSFTSVDKILFYPYDPRKVNGTNARSVASSTASFI